MAAHRMIDDGGELEALRFHRAAGLHVDEMERERVVVRGRRAARSKRENFKTGRAWIAAGGIEMNTDEDRIPGLVRNPRADFERDENIVFAGHDDPESFRLKHWPEFPRDIEGEIFFIPERTGRALVVTAVAGIEHN